MSGTTVFFDLETAGLEDCHPNIQVAAIAVRDWKEVDHLELKIDFDEEAADPEALKVNGYDPAAWKGAVTEDEAAHEFDDFCRRHADYRLIAKGTGRPYTMARLAGHNVTTFDIPRVRSMMDRAKIRFFSGCWWYPLDTYQRALWHFVETGRPPPANFQLQTLAQHFGIEAQGEKHEALADVRLCARIAQAIAEHK